MVFSVGNGGLDAIPTIILSIQINTFLFCRPFLAVMLAFVFMLMVDTTTSSYRQIWCTRVDHAAILLNSCMRFFVSVVLISISSLKRTPVMSSARCLNPHRRVWLLKRDYIILLHRRVPPFRLLKHRSRQSEFQQRYAALSTHFHTPDSVIARESVEFIEGWPTAWMQV